MVLAPLAFPPRLSGCGERCNEGILLTGLGLSRECPFSGADYEHVPFEEGNSSAALHSGGTELLCAQLSALGVVFAYESIRGT